MFFSRDTARSYTRDEAEYITSQHFYEQIGFGTKLLISTS